MVDTAQTRLSQACVLLCSWHEAAPRISGSISWWADVFRPRLTVHLVPTMIGSCEARNSKARRASARDLTEVDGGDVRGATDRRPTYGARMHSFQGVGWRCPARTARPAEPLARPGAPRREDGPGRGRVVGAWRAAGSHRPIGTGLLPIGGELTRAG